MGKIIGLAAQLGVGKDTVANYLVKRLNNKMACRGFCPLSPSDNEERWTRVGFADAVKRVFMDSFEVDLDFIEAWKRKDEAPPGFDLNVRKALQYIGDGFRQIQGDIWIKKALKIKQSVVISDCRYVNEAKMIKENGGVTVLLWRKGFDNDDPNPSESQIKPFVEWCVGNCKDGPITHYDSCPSCGKWWSELKYYDFFLKNEGSVEELYGKVDSLLMPYLKERGFFRE
jgi:hypothetical protein